MIKTKADHDNVCKCVALTHQVGRCFQPFPTRKHVPLCLKNLPHAHPNYYGGSKGEMSDLGNYCPIAIYNSSHSRSGSLKIEKQDLRERISMCKSGRLCWSPIHGQWFHMGNVPTSLVNFVNQVSDEEQKVKRLFESILPGLLCRCIRVLWYAFMFSL